MPGNFGLQEVNLIGLYTVDKNPDVTLVEVMIPRKADEFDISEFTQAIEGEARDNWQTAFSEKYLDLDGKKIIGDDFDLPKILSATTRLTFFIYFLDISKPMLTPFGQVQLKEKSSPPLRIKEIIFFENPE